MNKDKHSKVMAFLNTLCEAEIHTIIPNKWEE